jgi:hypothetical protein
VGVRLVLLAASGRETTVEVTALVASFPNAALVRVREIPSTRPAPVASAPAPAPAARRAAPAPSGVRRNARPAPCDRCDRSLPAGAGSLWRCLGSSSGCQAHWDGGDDGSEGGWHVSCPPAQAAACAARAAERVADARAAQAAEAARVAARTALRGVCVRPAPEGARTLVDPAPADRPPLGEPVETVWLGRRTAGSERLYLGPAGYCYVESSYDDCHEWYGLRTPALDAAVAAYRALAGAVAP